MDFSAFWNDAGDRTKRKELVSCLLSTFFWGLLAHSVALVSKFNFGDETAYLFSVGSTVASGRWFLGVLGWAVRVFFGSPNFSLPLLGGLMILLLSGVCSFQMVSLLKIRGGIFRFLLCGLMVTFPVTCSLFFYNFTAPYYLAGLSLTLAGTTVLCKKRSARSFCAGVFLMVLGTAVYQGYIAVFLSLLLMRFMEEVSESDSWTAVDLLKAAAWYCGACVVMILLYLLSVKASTALCGAELVNYKGMSSMGSITLPELLRRVKLAFYLFLFPIKSNPEAYLFPYRMIDLYYVCLAGLAGLGGFVTVSGFKKDFWKGLSLLLAFACFPLAVNFSFVICDPSEVYTLMQAASVMPFFLLLLLTERVLTDQKGRSADFAKKCVLAILTLFCVFSLRVDNAVYEKGAYTQSRIQQYFTVMVAQIKGTPGYTSTTPVAYVGDSYTYGDSTFRQIGGFTGLPIAPLRYDATPFVIGDSWEKFIDYCCGFAPPKADSAQFAALPKVQAMPCYPDEGSIRMVEGTVVVKLGK